jgi:hypothetical protein
MRFTWTGLILAPLPVPVGFTAMMVPPDQWLTLACLLFLVLGCIVGYATTILVFLPCLYLLSQWRPLTGFMVCLLGLALGAAAYLPVIALLWIGGSLDPTIPPESFSSFLLGLASEPITWTFPLAGLITAALYWWFGTRRLRQETPVQRA